MEQRSYHHIAAFMLLMFCYLQVTTSLRTKKILHTCKKPYSQCMVMNHTISTMCLGVKLPYISTSTDLVSNADNLEETKEKLDFWQGLKKAPKCWAAIQPFLCGLYIPKCENNSLILPSQEMCKMVENHCQIIQIENSWPDEFNCENETLYPKKSCINNFHELKFNTTAGHCESPLVQTYRHEIYHYPYFEGCDLQCYDPLFSVEEHERIHNLIVKIVTVAGLFNIFVILTFMIMWKPLNRYPNVAILYINVCFLLICFGWLLQFWFDARDDIVCRKNGSRKISEPSDEDLLCVINFIFTYYFLIAAFIWFAIFAYSFHTIFQSFGKIQEKVNKKSTYFHLMAWSIPLILCVIVMVIGEIDGDSITGICFVGNNNKIYKIIFVTVPIAISSLIGIFYLLRVSYKLWAIKNESKQVISKLAKSKIETEFKKVNTFIILFIVFVSSMCFYYINEYRYDHLWKDALRKYIVCKLNIIPDTDTENCHIKLRPSISTIQLYLLELFGNGVVMSFWVWTNKTLNTWHKLLSHCFKKCCGHKNNNQDSTEYNEQMLIASALLKKQQPNSDDLTVTLSNKDPFGLIIELNNNHTNNKSSTWAAALPKFIRRREALTEEQGPSISSSNNNSNSDISYSMCRVSVGSHSQHSFDSSMSVQTIEVARISKQVKNKQQQNNTLLCKLPSSQNGSVTSQDINQQLMLGYEEFDVFAHSDGAPPTAPIPNLNRRAALTGFEKPFENLSTLKNLSVSCSDLASANWVQMSSKGFNYNDLSEQYAMENISKIDINGSFDSVAIVNTDMEENGQLSNESNTE